MTKFSQPARNASAAPPLWRQPRAWLFFATLLWVGWAWRTLPAVPFHPDESTYLYMAQDARQLFREPLGLSFHDDGSIGEHYRLVNAPLTRYLVAIGLALHRQPALAHDWNWSVSWEANVQAGSVPTAGQLTAARQVTTLCVALAGLLLALTAYRLSRWWALAFLVLGGFLLNPLVLLHGRRAMMEAPMLLGIAWVLWELSAERISPWRLGLALSWAVWAKYWAIALLPVALWGVWRYAGCEHNRCRWRRMAVVVVWLAVSGFALQPVLWLAPWKAAQAMFARRFAVTATQQAAFRAVLPAYVPVNPWQRFALILGHLYIAPLAYLDLGKYAPALESAIAAYDAHVWAHWGRSLATAAVQIVLLFVGFGSMVWQALRQPQAQGVRLFMLAAAFQWGLLLLSLPLAFQRYALAALPFSLMWEAWGVWQLWRWLPRRKSKQAA